MISRWITQRPKLSKKNSPVDDPQVRRVYSMERCFAGNFVNHHMSLEDARVLMKYVCRLYSVRQIEINYTRTDEHVFGRTYVRRIDLNAGFHGDNIHVLVHELAHHVAAEVHPDDPGIEDHGPEFVAIYCYLLDRLNMIPDYCFEMMCDRWGVYMAKERSPEDFK